MANCMNIFFSEMHVAHIKPLSRMQSLSESRRGSNVAKPIFSDSSNRYLIIEALLKCNSTKQHGLQIAT